MTSRDDDHAADPTTAAPAPMRRVVPARRHAARQPIGRIPMISLGVGVGAVTLLGWLDGASTWPFVLGGLLTSAALLVVAGAARRIGVVLDGRRVGSRRILPPTTTWIDLGRVRLAIPALQVVMPRRGPSRHRPVGHQLVLTLWSTDQGDGRFATWATRMAMLPRQRRFVRAAEADVGRLRAFRVALHDYDTDDGHLIYQHIVDRLPAVAAIQLDEGDLYGRVLVELARRQWPDRSWRTA